MKSTALRRDFLMSHADIWTGQIEDRSLNGSSGTAHIRLAAIFYHITNSALKQGLLENHIGSG